MTSNFLPLALAASMLASPCWSQVGAPQQPIAAGPFESVVDVLRAARTCGLLRLRLELAETDESLREPARLFLDDTPTETANACLDNWTTANGKRLSLSPRWHGDTFEQTMHDRFAEARGENPVRRP